MRALARRAQRLFVEPAARSADLCAPRRSAAEHVGGHGHPGAGRLVVLLCAPRDAVALGTALALVLAGRERGAAGTVCAWGAAVGAASPGPALRSARASAARLAAAAVPAATPVGRVVHVLLPDDPSAARAALERVRTRSRGAAVVALAAARDDGWAPVLAEARAVVLAAPPGAEARLVELARAELPARCATVRVALAPVERALLAAGWWTTPGLRRRFAAVLAEIA